MILLWVYKLIIYSAIAGSVIAIIRGILRLAIRTIDKHTETIITDNLVDIVIKDPVIIAQLDNLEEQLEITNKQIVQQQQRLAILQRKKNTVYDHEERNLIDGEMLKIEANILKLSAKSDKIGFAINEIGIMYYNGN